MSTFIVPARLAGFPLLGRRYYWKVQGSPCRNPFLWVPISTFPAALPTYTPPPRKTNKSNKHCRKRALINEARVRGHRGSIVAIDQAAPRGREGFPRSGSNTSGMDPAMMGGVQSGGPAEVPRRPWLPPPLPSPQRSRNAQAPCLPIAIQGFSQGGHRVCGLVCCAPRGDV